MFWYPYDFAVNDGKWCSVFILHYPIVSLNYNTVLHLPAPVAFSAIPLAALAPRSQAAPFARVRSQHDGGHAAGNPTNQHQNGDHNFGGKKMNGAEKPQPKGKKKLKNFLKKLTKVAKEVNRFAPPLGSRIFPETRKSTQHPVM